MPVINLALAPVYPVIFRGWLHKAQIKWYTQRTRTDPWQHGYLIGIVGLADFIFGGVEKNGALVCPAGASV